jgi:hypothetical protein
MSHEESPIGPRNAGDIAGCSRRDRSPERGRIQMMRRYVVCAAQEPSERDRINFGTAVRRQRLSQSAQRHPASTKELPGMNAGEPLGASLDACAELRPSDARRMAETRRTDVRRTGDNDRTDSTADNGRTDIHRTDRTRTCSPSHRASVHESSRSRRMRNGTAWNSCTDIRNAGDGSHIDIHRRGTRRHGPPRRGWP